MSVAVKICGITAAPAIHAAAQAGARYVGLVFYPPSPRAVTLPQARDLLQQIPNSLKSVALCVDPTDELLTELMALKRLDMLQLHGSETPRRVAAIKAHTNLPIIKALPIATAEDFDAAIPYGPLIDMFLFDAKPPPGALPGGNALAFDWRIMAGRSFPRPWMLAGGLTPDNIAEAIRISGAMMVDVSSGVEEAPGVKSPTKITAFCQAAGLTGYRS